MNKGGNWYKIDMINPLLSFSHTGYSSSGENVQFISSHSRITQESTTHAGNHNRIFIIIYRIRLYKYSSILSTLVLFFEMLIYWWRSPYQVYHFMNRSLICEHKFGSSILNVKMNRDVSEGKEWDKKWRMEWWIDIIAEIGRLSGGMHPCIQSKRYEGNHNHSY